MKALLAGKIAATLHAGKSPNKWLFQQPTDRQQLFLSLDDTRECLFGGAAGGGKSSALLMDALKYVDVPGYAALMLRRTYADLSKPGALIDRAHQWLSNTSARWNETKKQWTFPSGATLSFGYMDSDMDRYQYQGCFDHSHEFLTKNGWKNIKDAVVGDIAASLNPTTRNVEYKPVTRTFVYDYAGDMINVYSKSGISFCVTPNHNVYVSSQKSGHLRKTQADKLQLTHKIPQWGTWTGIPAPATITFRKSRKSKGYTFKWKDFAEFLGWFVSEGHYADKYGGLGLTQINLTGAVEISYLLTRMGVDWKYNGKLFTFSCVSLANYLREHTKSLCYNKRLPRELLNYRSQDLWPLLRSLVEGDGTWANVGRNNPNGVYCTTSEGLADDVCELALICGYRPTKTLRKERPDNNRFGKGIPIWGISLCDKGRKDTSLESATRTLTKNTSGKVYCVSVPPNHSILIRHKGRVSWSGQSEYQGIFFDELTQFTELQYTYLFSRLRRLAGTDIPIKMRSSTNPGGTGARWVHERFIPDGFTPADAEEAKIFWKSGSDSHGDVTTRAFIPARLFDNPHLDREAYAESLRELDPVTREQLLQGDWQITERGDIFPMWDEKYHVISWSQFAKIYRESHIPQHWLRGVFVDCGTTEGHPNVTGWFTTAPDNAPLSGSVFLYRSVCEYGKTIREIAEGINKHKREFSSVTHWKMSHEANSERIALNRDFSLPFSSWKLDRNRGIAQARNYLEIRYKNEPHPFKADLLGRPSMYFIVNDDQLLHAADDFGHARFRAEIPVYHYQPSSSGMVIPHALFNDACDVLREAAADYFAPTLPLSSEEQISQKMQGLAGRTFEDILALPPAERGPAIDGWRLKEAEVRKSQDTTLIKSGIVRWRKQKARMW
jgi:hypothetical protein